jgi:hypothetical protein
MSNNEKDYQDELYDVASKLAVDIRNEWALEESVNNLYATLLYVYNMKGEI